MAIISLAIRSLINRRFTALLTVLAIAMSVTLLLGVEQIRREAKTSFANTISGTDLIVGARSGAIQLLLYSVFRIGNATNNIAWDSYQELAANPKVSWTIPLSLGDSHRGFRVLGTNGDYFEHFRYARNRQLTLAAGRPFTGLFEAVLGSEVAETLGYTLDQDIVVAHGVGAVGLSRHDDKPFRVVGILAKTGTPVDRTVHVSLESIEAIHVDWQGGARIPGMAISAEQVQQMALTPKTITAFMVGLHSKISTFSVQRAINEYRGEPLLAILPGVALQELWDLMSVAEQALLAISVFVVITGLIGMLTVILASLNERRREMAILRSVGARPAHIFGLLMTEAGLLASAGVLLGVVLLYALLIIVRPLVETHTGLFIAIEMLSARDMTILGLIVTIGFLIGIIPAIRAYRYSLADGMTLRL
ncbi:MAG: ABC transporter permease [Candidatus Competibacteraceae bacterium]|jgi:putative ABC transport system permease protein|nr:ABC transporter permease [Candidatus Competibacteraceae bacterium]